MRIARCRVARPPAARRSVPRVDVIDVALKGASIIATISVPIEPA
jgi:hypothetical protein